MVDSSAVQTLLIICLVAAGLAISIAIILIYIICGRRRRTVYDIHGVQSRETQYNNSSRVGNAHRSSELYGSNTAARFLELSKKDQTLGRFDSFDSDLPRRPPEPPGPSVWKPAESGDIVAVRRSSGSSRESDEVQDEVAAYELPPPVSDQFQDEPDVTQNGYARVVPETGDNVFISSRSDTDGDVRVSSNTSVVVRSSTEIVQTPEIPSPPMQTSTVSHPSSEAFLGNPQQPTVSTGILRPPSETFEGDRVQEYISSNTQDVTFAGRGNQMALGSPGTSGTASLAQLGASTSDTLKSQERKVTFRNKDSFRIIDNNNMSLVGIKSQKVDETSNYGFAKKVGGYQPSKRRAPQVPMEPMQVIVVEQQPDKKSLYGFAKEMDQYRRSDSPASSLSRSSRNSRTSSRSSVPFQIVEQKAEGTSNYGFSKELHRPTRRF